MRLCSCFGFAAIVLLAAPGAWAQAAQPALTARQAIDRIEKTIGAPANAQTVDTIKGGDPETPVTGIVTTFLDTYDVLERAAASGKNLIITHEPTFYNHRDDTTLLGDDPVQAQKEAFIREHHLVVWRFHDQWHARQPDGILEGVTAKLGWQKYQDATNPHTYTIPKTTLVGLAATLQNITHARAIRVVGDPGMAVTRVGLLPGASGESKQVKMLESDAVEVLVAGEASEWETVEYVRDAAAQHRHKALILLGHEVSEEPGMQWCAEWLRTLFPGMPIEFLPAKEPFWLPAHPVTP